MATKQNVTKDSIIREYLKKYPQMGPSEMAQKIMAERKDIVKSCKSQEISTIKSKVRAEAAGTTSKVSSLPIALAGPQSNGSVTMTDELPLFVTVNQLVKQVGYERVKQIVEALK